MNNINFLESGPSKCGFKRRWRQLGFPPEQPTGTILLIRRVTIFAVAVTQVSQVFLSFVVVPSIASYGASKPPNFAG